MPYRGVEYFRRKLNDKRKRVLLRYKYYEMKNFVLDFGIATPPDLRHWNSTVGWCAKAVDALADRLQFREFGDDYFQINQIFDLNNRDTLFDSAILSALIASCAFIYISPDEDGYPRLQVIDGGNATGEIDPITGLLKEGYAVLERNGYQTPTLEAYFTAEYTAVYDGSGALVGTWNNPAPYPLLVPMIFRADAMRPFGHSRISRACMSLVGSALRTIKRSEISAEFYSFPQKYIMGTDPGIELDKWRASMSSLLMISKDEDGEKPVAGQFSQQSMDPHVSQLRMFASLFAGETGLTLDDLGFVTDNPSSAEAIKASHENLRLTARKAQRSFGSGLLNAGYLAACVRDGYAYQRQQFYLTRPLWEPVFEPDAAMLSSIGDGAYKINQAVPGYFGEENLRDLTGIPMDRG